MTNKKLAKEIAKCMFGEETSIPEGELLNTFIERLYFPNTAFYSKKELKKNILLYLMISEQTMIGDQM